MSSLPKEKNLFKAAEILNSSHVFFHFSLFILGSLGFHDGILFCGRWRRRRRRRRRRWRRRQRLERTPLQTSPREVNCDPGEHQASKWIILGHSVQLSQIQISREQKLHQFINIKLFGYECMFVPPWRSQFSTDLAHFWHARPLGPREGHRLCKVAL